MAQNPESDAVVRKVWYKIYFSDLTDNHEEIDLLSTLINTRNDWDDLKRQLIDEVPDLEGYHVSQLGVYSDAESLQRNERRRLSNEVIGDMLGKSSSPIIVLVSAANPKKLRLSAVEPTEQLRTVWYSVITDLHTIAHLNEPESILLHASQRLDDLRVHCARQQNQGVIERDIQYQIKVYDVKKNLLDLGMRIEDVETTPDTALRIVIPSKEREVRFGNPSTDRTLIRTPTGGPLVTGIPVDSDVKPPADGLRRDFWFLERTRQVERLKSLADKNQIVVVFAPAASGKSALLTLFGYRYGEESDCTFVSCANETRKLQDVLNDTLVQVEKLQDSRNCYLLIDEAHRRFPEIDFWDSLFKSCPGTTLPTSLKIVFSVTTSLLRTGFSPTSLKCCAQMGLADVLMSDDEFNELIQHESYLRAELRTFQDLHALVRTECQYHIGQIIWSLQAVNDYVYHMHKKGEKIDEEEAIRFFLSDAALTKLDRCFWTCDEIKTTEARKILEACILGEQPAHSDLVGRLADVGILTTTSHGEIQFVSRMAQRFCLSKLFPNRAQALETTTLLSFVNSTLRRLVQRRIMVDSTFPSEHAFQRHLFSVFVDLTPPSIQVFPEYKNKPSQGQSKRDMRNDGRVDFFINGNLRWAIELAVNGTRIDDHLNRFRETGKYACMQPSDYVVIDLRLGKAGPGLKRDRHLVTVFFEPGMRECQYYYGESEPPVTISACQAN